MRHSHAVAAALAFIAGASPARAADCKEGKHCFVHNRYTPSHCWTITGSAPVTSVINNVTPTPAGPDGSPGPSKLMDGLTSFIPDPQVIASYKYVLVYGSSRYTFYDRATGQPLTASGCVPVNGTFRDLFAPLILDKDSTGAANADNINLQAPQTPIACDIHDIDKCPGSCVNQIYDARAYFERDGSGSGHWWIEVQGRNEMYTTDIFDDCPANGIQPEAARRYLMVAVSKTENPNDGFHEYVLTRDYADFPLFSVNNGRLLLGHYKSKKIFVFDSDKLAPGTDNDPFLGQYDEDTFADSDRITPVTQYGGGGGASYVLGENGNDLHVYAFIDPTKKPAHEQVTLDQHPSWYMQPVLRNGKFYLSMSNEVDSATERRAIDVFRVPVSLTSTSPIKIEVKKGQTHRISGADSTFERPGIEVETNDAVLVWYMRIGLTGSNPKPQARYNVHYPSDSGFDFRDGFTLHTGSGAATGDLQEYADIDLPGGNSDPDAVAFWISHAYSDAAGKKTQVVAQIKPGCGTETLCGTECANLKTDHDNCGSCGHECGKNAECKSGTCKSTSPSCGGANFMTDPKNCGGCGRVCETGKCTQGRCCEPCVCIGGFTAGACAFTPACEHICRAHEPH
jgi:hypothetical protein